MKEEFKTFRGELTKYTTEPSTYESSFSNYIKRIRDSSLSSQEIAELRDSIDTCTITSEGVKLRKLVGGRLQILYEERLRDELHRSKPWGTRFAEKYPLSKILYDLIKIVIGVIIGYLLK